MQRSISDIRKEYSRSTLSEQHVDPNPFKQFDKWWKEAIQSELDEANAMTLATASTDGVPAARIVLLKGFDDRGFTFFTNYNSYKGKHLVENPRACLVFFWKELERQVRITGLVDKISPSESDDYFNQRPESSRIGAWASPQSEVILNREWLEKTEKEFEKKYKGHHIPRPEYWGGYRVRPVTIEFWQGRPSRLHDRIQYSLQDDGNWLIERLAP